MNTPCNICIYISISVETMHYGTTIYIKKKSISNSSILLNALFRSKNSFCLVSFSLDGINIIDEILKYFSYQQL